MYEFGDEVIIWSYSRLIWIQLLAMLLLLLLILLLSSDSAAAPSKSKVRENEIKETGTSASEVVQRAKKPDGRPRAESSSTPNESTRVMFEESHHPCHFFGIAKHAFLKCLGIDSTREKED